MSNTDGSSTWVRWIAFPVLAVLTVIAAHLAHATLAWRWSPTIWHVLEPWVPSLVPAHAGYTVPPWPALLWCTLVLTCFFAFAVVSALVARTTATRTRWVQAICLWAGAILAAVCVTGMAQAGLWWLSVSSYGGLGGSHLRSVALPALAAAFRWGLLWGWLPAALAVLLPSHVPVQRRKRRSAVTVVLLIAVLTSGGCLAAANHGAALSARTEVAQREDPTEVTEVVPTDPPATSSPIVQAPFPERCRAEDLSLDIGAVDAATGSRYLAFTVTNQGSAACVLRGIPDLAFADDGGDEVRPSILERTTTMNGAPLTADQTRLEAGEHARADLVWRAPTGRPSAHTILIAPWQGAERTAFAETIDVADGAEMTLSRWYSPGT